MSSCRAGWGAVAVLVTCVACGGGAETAGEGEGSAGGEAITFPDEAAAQREAEGPPATETVARAEALLAQGEAAEAKALLEQALSEDPDDPRAHLDMGLAHEMLEDLEAAEASYRASLEAAPGFPEALNNLGLVLREQERYDEAIPVLRQAVEAKPDLASARVNLALALEEGGELEEAAAAYRDAARLAPRDPLTRANLGLVLLELGEREQAAIELRRALPLARQNTAALQAIGNGLRRAGQFDVAVRAMERAVASTEDEPTPALLAELALAQRAAGDREAAEATLRQALGRDPEYATGHYLLANMLAGRRAFGEAVRHFERYLELAPDGPYAAEARERIQAARAAD